MPRPAPKIAPTLPELTDATRDALLDEMLQALQTVESRLAALRQALEQSLTATVVVRGSDGTEGRIRDACTALTTLTIESDDAPATPFSIGVIGVPAQIVRLAEEVNAAKAEMKACWSTAHRYIVNQPKPGAAGKYETVSLARLLLRRLGRTNLSLQAAYRKIPVLEKRPTRVVFHLTMTRTTCRVTRKTLVRLLSQSQSPQAAADRRTLADRPDVQFAAIVSKRYPNHRANVWLNGLDTCGRGMIQVRAELPILYPRGRHASPPEVIFPQVREGSPRRARTDAIVEDEPFLPSINACRYKPRKNTRRAPASGAALVQASRRDR